MLKAIISDFDGTLVDTFKANLMAYQEAFQASCRKAENTPDPANRKTKMM